MDLKSFTAGLMEAADRLEKQDAERIADDTKLFPGTFTVQACPIPMRTNRPACDRRRSIRATGLAHLAAEVRRRHGRIIGHPRTAVPLFGGRRVSKVIFTVADEDGREWFLECTPRGRAA